MDTPKTLKIVTAERIGADLLIEFADGAAGVYPAHFLRAHLDEATPVEQIEEE
jgi:hypothetical protein